MRYYRESYLMNFTTDPDMGILYLSTKFEFEWSSNDRDLLVEGIAIKNISLNYTSNKFGAHHLLSDKNLWKHTQRDKQTDTH